MKTSQLDVFSTGPFGMQRYIQTYKLVDFTYSCKALFMLDVCRTPGIWRGKHLAALILAPDIGLRTS